MVSYNHPIHGLVQCETVQDLQNMLDYLDSKIVKKSVRTWSSKGAVRDGSPHDLWNKADDNVRAEIIRAFAEDNANDHTILNRYTVPMLISVKPRNISFTQWLASTNGKLDVDNKVIIELIKEYEKSIESWNTSRLYKIVKWYSTTRRAMMVNDNISESRAIV